MGSDSFGTFSCLVRVLFIIIILVGFFFLKNYDDGKETRCSTSASTRLREEERGRHCHRHEENREMNEKK